MILWNFSPQVKKYECILIALFSVTYEHPFIVTVFFTLSCIQQEGPDTNLSHLAVVGSLL
jgi:hypothetical protein